MNASRPSLLESRGFALAWVVVGVLFAGGTALAVALNENHHEDLWIYSSGAALGWAGQSPYDTELIRERFAQQYPPDAGARNKALHENCGYFLAPQAMLLFAPALPWPWVTAKVLWCLATVGMAALAGWILLPAFGSGQSPRSLRGIAAFAVLCNPMSLFALVLGQTSLFFFACVVFGHWLYRAGWPTLGNLVWALAFFKPHLAFPLLALAWVANGWRRALGIAAWVLVLNVITGVVTTGNPLILLDYVRYLEEGHKAVVFNRVATNLHISSWNRLVATLGGPVFELGAKGTIAGYAIWFCMCWLRSVARRVRPDLAWQIAAVGVGIPLCCQTLPYELPVLLLTLPWLVEMVRRGSVTVPLLAVAFTSIALLLGGAGSSLDLVAKRLDMPLLTALLESHQSFFVALCATLVLLFPSPSK